MHCIVFGGAGFIGSYICEALLASGQEVTVFEKRGGTNSNIQHIKDKINIIQGDFSSSDDVKNALIGVDVVFHLIATTNPQTSNIDLAYDVNSNLISTLGLLEALKETKVKKIIFFSSGGTVYGKPQQIPIPEQHPKFPLCSYGIHKLAIEKYLHLYNQLFGLDYSVLRIANPYGPRQSAARGQGVIAAFIDKILNRAPIEVWGDGLVIRDYIFVSDVAAAAVALLTYTGEHRTFNIGSGEGHSLKEIIQNIELHVNHSGEVIYKPPRALDVPVNVLDISRAKQELSWQPTVTLFDGISKTIASVRKKKQ